MRHEQPRELQNIKTNNNNTINNMEMTRSERTEENEPLIAPSPFDSSAEREFLNSQLDVPTAVPVDDAFQENTSAVAVAVAAPITNSVLDSSSMTSTASAASTAAARKEEDTKSIDDDIIVKPEPDGATNISHLPAAHAIPSAGSLIQQQHTASGQLRAANFKGILSSEEEIAGIARAHRGIPELQRDADEAVRAANIAALGKKGKKDEGLAVDHMIHHLNVKCSFDEKVKKEDEDISQYANGNRGGYKVKEYKTSEYKISEYKSVYD
ncbi:hypothetical protein QTG54_001140 [Skeletonema marinoi]|uniref:Uncharacterized protein n=1 Tax=Skeletonema marinoi TaxID=267567 RepID=A0AAD9DIK4_9STRA|nr:hypothetical protein QTG54_001140 [Skeletonema marinoi]